MDKNIKKIALFISIALTLLLVINIVYWGGLSSSYEKLYNEKLESISSTALSSAIEILSSKEMTSSDKINKMDLKIAMFQSALVESPSKDCIKDAAIAIIKYNVDSSTGQFIPYRIVSFSETTGTSASLNKAYKEINDDSSTAFPAVKLTNELVKLYNQYITDDENSPSIVIKEAALLGDTYYPTIVAVRTYQDNGYSDSDPIEIKYENSGDLEKTQLTEDAVLLIGGSNSRFAQDFKNEIQNAIILGQSLSSKNLYLKTQKMMDENYAIAIKCNAFSLPTSTIVWGIFVNFIVILVLGFIVLILFARESPLNIKTDLKPGEFKIPVQPNSLDDVQNVEKENQKSEEFSEQIEIDVESLSKKDDVMIQPNEDLLSKINNVISSIEKELSKKPSNADALSFTLTKYKTASQELLNGREVKNLLDGCAKLYSESCNKKKDRVLPLLKEVESLLS